MVGIALSFALTGNRHQHLAVIGRSWAGEAPSCTRPYYDLREHTIDSRARQVPDANVRTTMVGVYVALRLYDYFGA